jgi:hypothetical protein
MRRVRSPERVEERRGGFGRWIGPDQEHSIDTLEPGPLCVRSCQVTRRPTTRALTAPVSAACQSTRPHLGQAPVVLSQQPGPVDRFVRVSASPDSHGTVKILLVSGSLRTAVLAPATRACPPAGRRLRFSCSLVRDGFSDGRGLSGSRESPLFEAIVERSACGVPDSCPRPRRRPGASDGGLVCP